MAFGVEGWVSTIWMWCVLTRPPAGEFMMVMHGVEHAFVTGWFLGPYVRE